MNDSLLSDHVKAVASDCCGGYEDVCADCMTSWPCPPIRIAAALACHTRIRKIGNWTFNAADRCTCDYLWDTEADRCTSPTVKALLGES